MAFDYNGAKQEGYSDVDILDHLKKTRPDFDYSGAMAEGYGVSDITDHLNSKPPKTTTPQPPLNVQIPPVSMPVMTAVPAVSTRTDIQPAPLPEVPKPVPLAANAPARVLGMTKKMPVPEETLPVTPPPKAVAKEWTKKDEDRLGTYAIKQVAKGYANIGKLVTGVSADAAENFGYVADMLGEKTNKPVWDKVSKAAADYHNTLTKAGKTLTDFYQPNPAEQETYQRSGPAGAAFVGGIDMLGEFLPTMIATGGGEQARAIMGAFAKKYGPTALVEMKPIIQKAVSEAAKKSGKLITADDVEKTIANTVSGFEQGFVTSDGGLKERVKQGAVTGAQMAAFSAAGKGAEMVTGKMSAIPQRVAQSIAQGSVFGGMAAAQGASPSDIISNFAQGFGYGLTGKTYGAAAKLYDETIQKYGGFKEYRDFDWNSNKPKPNENYEQFGNRFGNDVLYKGLKEAFKGAIPNDVIDALAPVQGERYIDYYNRTKATLDQSVAAGKTKAGAAPEPQPEAGPATPPPAPVPKPTPVPEQPPVPKPPVSETITPIPETKRPVSGTETPKTGTTRPTPPEMPQGMNTLQSLGVEGPEGFVALPEARQQEIYPKLNTYEQGRINELRKAPKEAPVDQAMRETQQMPVVPEGETPIPSGLFNALSPDQKQKHYENLEKLAYTDQLTGLGNRNTLVKDNIDIRTADQTIHDLDNFKSINDTYGHPVGDKVLKKFADVLQKAYGDKAKVVRIGGEEIATFPLKSLDAQSIINIERRANEELANTTFDTDKGPLRGVTFSSGHGAGYDAADAQVYKSKEAGKSGVSVDGRYYEYTGNRPITGLRTEELQPRGRKPGAGGNLPENAEPATATGKPVAGSGRAVSPGRTEVSRAVAPTPPGELKPTSKGREPQTFGDDPKVNTALWLRATKSGLRKEVLDQPKGQEQWDFLMGKKTKDNKGRTIVLTNKSNALVKDIYDYWNESTEAEELRNKTGIPKDLFTDFEDVARQLQEAPHPFEVVKPDKSEAFPFQQGEEEAHYAELAKKRGLPPVVRGSEIKPPETPIPPAAGLPEVTDRARVKKYVDEQVLDKGKAIYTPTVIQGGKKYIRLDDGVGNEVVIPKDHPIAKEVESRKKELGLITPEESQSPGRRLGEAGKENVIKNQMESLVFDRGFFYKKQITKDVNGVKQVVWKLTNKDGNVRYFKLDDPRMKLYDKAVEQFKKGRRTPEEMPEEETTAVSAPAAAPAEMEKEEEFGWKQAGFTTEKDFNESYDKNALKDVGETKDEYLQRVYCKELMGGQNTFSIKEAA